MICDLSYAEPIGREAALELLNVAFMKFPLALLSGLGETIFVPLVARLAAEDDRRVRAVCGAAIKVLLGRLDKDSLASLFLLCADWAERREDGSNQRVALAPAAVQVLGFFAESGRCSKPERARAVALLQRGLLDELAAPATEEGDWLLGEHEARAKHARRDAFVYQACLSLERFVALESQARLEQHCSNGLLRADPLCGLLRYPHVWIRASASRLVDLLLFQSGLGQTWPVSDRSSLCDAFCNALDDMEAETACDKGVIASMLKNVLALMSSGATLQKAEAATAVSPSPRTKRLKSLVVADADDREDSSHDLDDSKAAAKSASPAIDSLLTRLASIVLKGPVSVKAGVLQAMTALIVRLPPTDAAALASVLLGALYSVVPWDHDSTAAGLEHGRSGGGGGGEVPADLLALGDQILKAVRNHIGVTAFASAANAVREAASASGRASKQKSAASFVVDSVQANRKKLKQLEERKKKKWTRK